MRSSWAVFPNVSDELRISIPAAWIVTKEGRKLRLPQLQETINIKPLPQNTPKNIIIGKPKINVSPLRVTNQVNELSSWRYTVTAAAPSTVFSQKLALSSMPQVRLFTDRVNLTANEEQGILNHVAEYTISAMPLAPGSYTLPPIYVSYFDPDTGRLSSIRQEGITLSAIATANPLNTSLSNPETMMSLPNHEKNSSTLWQAITLGITFLWLITSALLLWHIRLTKKKSPRIEKENAATPPVESSARPLERQLLHALNSRSLEQGLKQWENTHGTDNELRNTIRSVQTLYYGQQQKPNNEKELTTQVSRFIEKRRNQPREPAHQQDKWSPRAFTQPSTDEK